MAKNQDQNDEVIVDVQEVYSKTETYIEDNKNNLSIIVVALVVLIGGYFSYQNFYIAPLQEEAQQEMFMAEKYFALDSFNIAINGSQEFAGLLEITDKYGSTKAGNLAHYYLGISFLRTGQFEAAISELEDFSSDDKVISTMAIGSIGDAYMELGDLNKASSSYDKAANNEDNSFTSAYYLLKAGKTYEILGDHSEAVERFTSIKKDFSKSAEAAEIDKLIARAESFVK
jgi:tetratricopeptide (TPR) repeat protein